MDPPVVFSVANEDDIPGTMNPCPFDTILYNEKNHFNISDHHFTAPSAGIYYCSPASGGVILVLSCDMTNCIIFHIFPFFLASVASMCIHFCTIMYYVYLYRYVSL